MVLSSDYGDKALKDTLDDVMKLGWETDEWQFTDMYKVEDMEDQYVEEAIIQYPDEVAVVQEGGAFTRVDIEHVAYARYDAFTFKTEIAISMEADEDIRYAPMIAGSEALGVALHRTVERYAARNYYNGLSSVLSPRDGLSIFNTAHVCSKAVFGHPSTWSNRSQLKLTNANLKARRTAGRKQLDEHGSPVGCKFDQLIVGPDLMYTAEEYIESVNDPDTAQNRKNVGSRGLKLIVNDYFQEAPFSYAANMWSLRDSRKAKNKFKWKKHPDTYIEFDPKTRNKLYQVVARIAIGWSEDHGVDFSTGEL